MKLVITDKGLVRPTIIPSKNAGVWFGVYCDEYGNQKSSTFGFIGRLETYDTVDAKVYEGIEASDNFNLIRIKCTRSDS